MHAAKMPARTVSARRGERTRARSSAHGDQDHGRPRRKTGAVGDDGAPDPEPEAEPDLSRRYIPSSSPSSLRRLADQEEELEPDECEDEYWRAWTEFDVRRACDVDGPGRGGEGLSPDDEAESSRLGCLAIVVDARDGMRCDVESEVDRVVEQAIAKR